MRQHGDELARAYGKCTREQASDPGEKDFARPDTGAGAGAGHTHDQPPVGHKAAIHTKDAGAKSPAGLIFVLAANVLQSGWPGMAALILLLRIRDIASIDRHPAHFGSRQHVTHGVGRKNR